jgi:pyruvate dehydrogenase E1 component alpha subunit
MNLYSTIYLIRRCELKIQEIYARDEMKTPMHMSMGEEAVVAGVVRALKREDQVLGTYRSHALYLAKTLDAGIFFAEMFGKVTGCARGKAGSMHLSAPEHGLLCCSAIVASSIPVAMGAAFANKYQGNGKRVAVFFGDGAMDEGVFWETINFSALHGLPILFICEDNGFAVHTPKPKRQGFGSDAQLFGSFGIRAFEEKTTDPEAIYQTTRLALDHLRDSGKPCFLRFHYYRYLEHVGINEDFDAGYRSREEFAAWRLKDPLLTQRRKLVELGVGENELTQMEKEIDDHIDTAVSSAAESTFPTPDETYQGVFQCV